jgi:hypothetical protein
MHSYHQCYKLIQTTLQSSCDMLSTNPVFSSFTVTKSINSLNIQKWEIQGEHKVFPGLQIFITRKLLYVEYKLFLYVTSFFTTP